MSIAEQRVNARQQPFLHTATADSSAAAIITSAAGLRDLFGTPAECIQITPGAFQAEIHTRFGSGFVRHHQICAQGFHLRARRPVNALLVGCLVSKSGPALFNGMQMKTNQLAVVGADGLNLSLFGMSEIVWVEMYFDGLQNAAQELALELASGPSGRLVYSSALRNRLCDDPTIDAFIRTLYAQRSEATTRAFRAQLALVIAAEGFALEHLDEPPTLRMLCRWAACSARAMSYAFKAVTGLSPVAYITLRRLNEAHRALAHGACNGTSRLCDLAADYGFFHMGHFGQRYKDMFGVTPSTPWKRVRHLGRIGENR